MDGYLVILVYFLIRFRMWELAFKFRRVAVALNCSKMIRVPSCAPTAGSWFPSSNGAFFRHMTTDGGGIVIVCFQCCSSMIGSLVMGSQQLISLILRSRVRTIIWFSAMMTLFYDVRFNQVHYIRKSKDNDHCCFLSFCVVLFSKQKSVFCFRLTATRASSGESVTIFIGSHGATDLIISRT